MEPLTLQCWIYGEDIGRIFKVKTSRTERVTYLKYVIKNEMPATLRDMDAGSLALYKIFLLDATDAQLEESLKNLSVGKEERLGPLTKLSMLFPESTPSDDDGKTTIIVIDIATLNRWVRGQGTNRVFEGDCHCDTALKRAIRNNMPRASLKWPVWVVGGELCRACG